MGGEIQIPTAITGTVTKLVEISYCMDGATHQIHSYDGATRLKGRNPEATKALDDVANGKIKATVMGYPVIGPECTHLSVYSVSDAAEVVKLMGGDYWPWKTINLKLA